MVIQYRPDIDGLRALAVLLVIFNHLNISLFSGGFIGVDVFFVISGYLITSIIYKQMNEDKFSVAQFYKKRIIRLAPALFTVLLAVSALSIVVMLPNELVQYFDSLFNAVFFLANVYMRKEVGDYFSSQVDEIPLLHLWSLAIEEQFYVFWPLFLFIIVKKINPRYLFLIILVLIGVFAYQAEMLIYENENKAYYRLSARASEMLLGAFLVFLPKINIKKMLAHLFIIIGLVVVVACSIYFDESTRFPGLNALIPCLATAIIIYFGQSLHQHNPILANPLTEWIGKLSYPMYLWHWPIIVFLNIYMISWSGVTKIGVLLFTILIAALTYYFIEQPAKKFLSYSAKKVFVFGFIIPVIGFSVAAYAIKYSKGLPQRFDTQVMHQIEALQSEPNELRKDCHGAPDDHNALPNRDVCRFGQEQNAEVEVLLIGDSHANSIFGAVELWAKKAGLRGYDPTQNTTMYLPGVKLFNTEDPKKIKLNEQFQQRNDAITKHLQQSHYAITIMSGYYSGYLSGNYLLKDELGQTGIDVFRNAFIHALEQAFAASDRVILVLDVPELYALQANCPARIYALNLDKKCTVPQWKIKQRDAGFLQILSEVKHRFPQLEIINPQSILCDAKECKIDLNGIPLYRNHDDDHLSYLGARELGKVYLQQFGNPLK